MRCELGGDDDGDGVGVGGSVGIPTSLVFELISI